MKLFKRNALTAMMTNKPFKPAFRDVTIVKDKKQLISEEAMLETSLKFGDGITWDVEELKHDSSIKEDK